MAKSRFILAAVMFALLVAFVLAPASASAAPSNWGYSGWGYSGGCNPCGGGYQTTATGYVLYRVQWGDTLSSIAAAYGTSTWYLASLNGLYNPNCLFAGEVLRVPAYSTASYGCGGYAPCGGYVYNFQTYGYNSYGYANGNYANYGYGGNYAHYGYSGNYGYRGYGVGYPRGSQASYGPYRTNWGWGRR
jgi:LysM repeat protein